MASIASIALFASVATAALAKSSGASRQDASFSAALRQKLRSDSMPVSFCSKSATFFVASSASRRAFAASRLTTVSFFSSFTPSVQSARAGFFGGFLCLGAGYCFIDSELADAAAVWEASWGRFSASGGSVINSEQSCSRRSRSASASASSRLLHQSASFSQPYSSAVGSWRSTSQCWALGWSACTASQSLPLGVPPSSRSIQKPMTRISPSCGAGS